MSFVPFSVREFRSGLRPVRVRRTGRQGRRLLQSLRNRRSENGTSMSTGRGLSSGGCMTESTVSWSARRLMHAVDSVCRPSRKPQRGDRNELEFFRRVAGGKTSLNGVSEDWHSYGGLALSFRCLECGIRPDRRGVAWISCCDWVRSRCTGTDREVKRLLEMVFRRSGQSGSEPWRARVEIGVGWMGEVSDHGGPLPPRRSRPTSTSVPFPQ